MHENARVIPLRSKLVFWALLTGLSVLFVEVSTNSSPFAFFSAWGLLSVCPLYGLHVLVLGRIAFLARSVRLPALYSAGAILGLYEAYITKVLWAPTWGPHLWTAGGVHVFQTAILVLLAHPFMAFVLPLLAAEMFFTSSSEIVKGLPKPLHRWLGTPGGRVQGAVAIVLYFGAYHGLAPKSPVEAFVTALINTLVVVALGVWWCRKCRGDMPRLRELLPNRRQFVWLSTFLGIYYLLSGAFLRREAMPHTMMPHLTILALYAALIIILVRAIRGASESGPTEQTDVAPLAERAPLWLFLIGFPLASALFALTKPFAGVVVMASWVIGCVVGLALIVAAAGPARASNQ